MSIRLFYVFGLFTLGSSDLPVHCLRHQIAGDWEFVLTPPSEARSSCGHQRPDHENSEPPLSLAQFGGEASTLPVKLEIPNKASSSEGEGSWTMIYDEGFEVRVSDKVFFAFSRFDLRFEHGIKVNTSICNQTLVGWYKDVKEQKFGCYIGHQIAGGAVQGGVPLSSESYTRGLWNALGFSFFQEHAKVEKRIVHRGAGLPSHLRKGGLMTNSLSVDLDDSDFLEEFGLKASSPLPSQFHEKLAGKLNARGGTWTAKAYSDYTGLTWNDLNKKAGIRRDAPRFRRSLPASFLSAEGLKFYDNSMAKVEPSLPASFDWGNVDGRNFLEPVLSQGDCGSCFTVATVRMLSARYKIMNNDTDLDPFSISFPLYCSEYNQGCDGGYAFLASKWSEDVGLVPSKCAQYTTSGSCQVSSSCLMELQQSSRFRATEHNYVGGYYGGSTAGGVMEELVKNGPLVVSFEPSNDFMYYSGGIYQSQGEQNEVQPEWEKVDHAVLLVGYGTDPETGTKFWKVQNSWGADWGEEGFFRIKRGVDESGIESIAVSAKVEEDKRDVSMLYT